VFVFCLPGSNGAVRDGWDKVIAAQLDSRHRPCNMVEADAEASGDMSRLSHLDDQGRARMVDVSEKPATAREAVARGLVRMMPATRDLGPLRRG